MNLMFCHCLLKLSRRVYSQCKIAQQTVGERIVLSYILTAENTNKSLKNLCCNANADANPLP